MRIALASRPGPGPNSTTGIAIWAIPVSQSGSRPEHQEPPLQPGSSLESRSRPGTRATEGRAAGWLRPPHPARAL